MVSLIEIAAKIASEPDEHPEYGLKPFELKDMTGAWLHLKPGTLLNRTQRVIQAHVESIDEREHYINIPNHLVPAMASNDADVYALASEVLNSTERDILSLIDGVTSGRFQQQLKRSLEEKRSGVRPASEIDLEIRCLEGEIHAGKHYQEELGIKGVEELAKKLL